MYQIEVTYDDIPPDIIFTIPPGSNVSIIANISVVFSEAMNQTSVESAISISPTISGISYTWLNDQTLVVHFSGVIPFNTTFSITIDTGAKDLAGNILANDYSWQFMTADEPEIVQPSVSNDWGWIIMIIILSAIIVLLLFYLFRERKEKEPEE